MLESGILFVDTDRTQKMTKIISGKGSNGYLYLGNEKGANDIVLLTSNKITAILTVASEIKLKSQHGRQIMHIDIQDTPSANIQAYFEKCHQFIQRKLKTGNVFVHCRMGISRSATIVIAYLMIQNELSLKQALSKVKKKRPMINPNSGFLLQLDILNNKQQQNNSSNVKNIKKT